MCIPVCRNWLERPVGNKKNVNEEDNYQGTRICSNIYCGAFNISLFLNKGNTDMTAEMKPLSRSRLYKYGRGTCEYDAWLPFFYGRKIYMKESIMPIGPDRKLSISVKI